jgi:hypothetical protein
MSHQIPDIEDDLHDRDYIWIDINSSTQEITQNEVLDRSIQSFLDSLDTLKTSPSKRKQRPSDPMFQRVVFKGMPQTDLQNYDGTSILEEDSDSDDSYQGRTCSLSKDGSWSTRSEMLSLIEEERTSEGELADDEESEADVTKPLVKASRKLIRLEGEVADGEKSKVEAPSRRVVRSEEGDEISIEDSGSEENDEVGFLGRDKLGLAATCTAILIAGMWVLEK